ncbi:8-amino-7-oxononanoate synthase [Hahella sp. SMD15-11]|uniref:8-amino-7-oxononanoate synthase n=1 Tax=Thermohahella caldifontis TaxID=3142973 RepID=A0AB39V080_9GAMM
MTSSWRNWLEARVAERAGEGLLRQRLTVESPQGREVTVAGRTCLQFCSNDYLGLAASAELAEAFTRGVEDWGVGAGASHLVNGHLLPHEQLEREFAEFAGRDGALLFSAGYMANLGVIDALADRQTEIFEDRLNHASLLDGARLSGARLKRYRHGDPEHLDTLLASSAAPRKLVVTDGVFSMDGDLAPLPDLVRICQKHDALLMVDDAHGIGVLGAGGRGTLEVFGLDQEQVPVLVATFGKALGVAGAIVSGPDWLIRALEQFARTSIYTTAQPPALAEATRAALKMVREGHALRMQVQMLVARFRAGCENLGLPLMDSQTPIQPLLTGDAARTLEASRRLLEAGILVTAIRPPTVPARQGRLRFTFSAAHRLSDVDHLLRVLERELVPWL